MSVRKYLSEFGLNMRGAYALVLQQPDLATIRDKQGLPRFHIYMVARRPRIALDPKSVRFTQERFHAVFKLHRKETVQEIEVVVPNRLGTADVSLVCEYPYTEFSFRDKAGAVLTTGKTAILLGVLHPRYMQHLDLEVMYIGQSYGTEGGRTAIERLESHSTLQGIYAEAMRRSPDQEIWLMLWSFEQMLLASFDGRTGNYGTSMDEDSAHMRQVIASGISEQQRINFTEAALIRYFQPTYNKIYKDSFPNPAHSTYAECYDLDLNAVAVELDTEEVMCRLWSEAVSPQWVHLMMYPLHSREERKSMFEL